MERQSHASRADAREGRSRPFVPIHERPPRSFPSRNVAAFCRRCSEPAPERGLTPLSVRPSSAKGDILRCRPSSLPLHCAVPRRTQAVWNGGLRCRDGSPVLRRGRVGIGLATADGSLDSICDRMRVTSDMGEDLARSACPRDYRAATCRGVQDVIVMSDVSVAIRGVQSQGRRPAWQPASQVRSSSHSQDSLIPNTPWFRNPEAVWVRIPGNGRGQTDRAVRPRRRNPRGESRTNPTACPRGRDR